MNNKKTFINITPKWADIIGLYIEAIQSGDANRAKPAIEEIKRLAVFADTVNASNIKI